MSWLKYVVMGVLVLFIALAYSFPNSLVVYTLNKNSGGLFDAWYELPHNNEPFDYVLYNGLTQADIEPISSQLNQHYQTVLVNLGVQAMPVVTVRIWRDYEAFQAEQALALGQRYKGSMGYVTWAKQPEIRLMYKTEAQSSVAVLHEFAHLVSLAVNSTIANNPRWLWESIALFEAGSMNVLPQSIDYLLARDFPTLAELNRGYNQAHEQRNIYQVGYVLAEYVVARWGRVALVNLVKNNGDVQQTLNVSTEEFESGWYDFIEKTYL